MVQLTQIARNQRPVEYVDPLERQAKSMGLTQMAMQNQRLGNQMKTEQTAAATKDYLRRAQLFGEEMQALSGVPEEQRPQAYLQLREKLIKNRVATPDQLPEQFSQSFYGATLARLHQMRPYLENENLRAQIANTRMQGRKKAVLADLTPGEKKADEFFGKDSSEYYYGGGKATVEKNLGRLENAINVLEQNPELTGGTGTQIASIFGDKVEDIFNPEMVEVRDEIRSAIQGSLKQILGGQFTEKEAEAMFSRAFNPRLSAEENIRRAQSELNALQSMAASKDQAMAYFEEKGTLKGFKPSRTQSNPTRVARKPRREGGGMSVEPEAHASGAGKVRVSNGKETYVIDLEDLPDAKNDGYEVVR
tara:strand:+ start:4034 stop:5122 length:1089 start_codon:yes stop_codon:yes gene_type:complete